MPTPEENFKIGNDVIGLLRDMDRHYGPDAEVAMVGLVVGVKDADRQIVHFDVHNYFVIEDLTARSLLEHALSGLKD